MKLITRGSYLRMTAELAANHREMGELISQNACLIRDNARQSQTIDGLQRGRTGHEQKSYEAQTANAELCEKNSRLRYNLRAAERRVQELTLLVGIKGFAVEMTPDVPATPARPGVLTLAKISK